MADLETEEDAADDKAVFCLRTGVQPSEYDALTDTEIAAFTRAYNTIHAKQ